MVFFLLFGHALLVYLNIAIYSFKIAGGIILLIISLEMLLDKRSLRKEKSFQKNAISTSLFPLAIPLLAGPAAITSVMVSSSNNAGNFLYSVTHIASLFSVLLITYNTILISGNVFSLEHNKIYHRRAVHNNQTQKIDLLETNLNNGHLTGAGLDVWIKAPPNPYHKQEKKHNHGNKNA